MERLKPILSLLCLLIAAGNIAEGLIFSYGLFWFIGYPGTQVIIAAILFFFGSKISLKTIAYMFYAMSIASIGMGDRGNLSSAFFLCVAFQIFENMKVFKYALAITVLAILPKAISHYTVPQTYKLLVGLFGMVAVWYEVFVRPKQIKRKVFTEEDNENANIMQYVVNGLSYKEIADLVNISQSAISKRLERFRGRMDAKSNEELAILLSRSGQIVLKSDR